MGRFITPDQLDGPETLRFRAATAAIRAGNNAAEGKHEAAEADAELARQLYAQARKWEKDDMFRPTPCRFCGTVTPGFLAETGCSDCQPALQPA
jgi:hypothetical protein